MQKITIDVKRETFDVAAVEGSANSIQILFINSPAQWSDDELSVYALFSKGDKGEVYLVDKASMAVNVPNFAVAENAGFKVTLFAMNSDATTPYRYVMPPVWVQVKEGYECDAIIGPSKDNMDAISTLIQTMQTNITVYDKAESVRADAETARNDAEDDREDAEDERDANEKARKTAETARGEAEDVRKANEEVRNAAEDDRDKAEKTRDANETARKTAEDDRASAEGTRAEAEEERISNENLRVAAELDRQAAEDARIAYINSVIASKFDVASGLSKDYTDSLAYYDDPNIKPTDANCFSFTLDDETMTASISCPEDEAPIEQWEKFSSIVDLVIPHHYIAGDKIYAITSIANGAFYGCSIKSVIIPNTVTTIGDDVFSLCESLQTIKIPDSVTIIGSGAFSETYSLTEIKLPKNLKVLNSRTFTYCESLKTVIIPEGAITIGDEVFANCASLESVVIPESVTSIGSDLFCFYEEDYYEELPEIIVFYNGTYDQWDIATNGEDVLGYWGADVLYLGAATQEYVDEGFDVLWGEIDSLSGNISDANDLIGDLGELTTSNNDSLVGALNEVNGKKVDKTILITKTRRIKNDDGHFVITDTIPLNSEIKFKFTGLIPEKEGYGIDGDGIDYVSFKPDSEGKATVTFPIDDQRYESIDEYNFWIAFYDDEYVDGCPVTEPFIVEYICIREITDAIAEHEALINDIDIALDNVIAKYELGGDV